MKLLNRYRIFLLSVALAVGVVGLKYILHTFQLETIELGSLHSSLISGVIFVLGFLMSATIADYKEAERIPADVASAIENMREDVRSIAMNYPKFDLSAYEMQLEKVASTFAGDVRNSKSHQARKHIAGLTKLNAQMETAGVPANFIVKLKQQQSLILRQLHRVNYIQRITFIPSASILAWSIVLLAITLLLATEIEPFFAGIVLTGGISFILVYVLQLLRVIRTPFHDEGKTQDDVSLFLLDRIKTNQGEK
jgi:hypothetical protein